MSPRNFSECLNRLRKEAGFSSAYQFYHRNGGRKNFPFTYVHYLRIEKGAALPKPQWIGIFLTALRLTPGEPGCRDIFLAYMKDLLQTEEAYNMILAPLLEQHREGKQPPGADALRWMKSEHAVHLQPEQFRLLACDPSVYWSSEILCNDHGSWNAAEIARILEEDPKKIQKALAKLEAAGLARETSGKRYKWRWTGKFYTFPGRLAGMEKALDAVRSYWDRMFRKKGKLVGDRIELVRAEESVIRNYCTHLSETLDLANTLATHSQGSQTGLFAIEARVRKLLPF